MKISMLIHNLNRAEATGVCLRSLEAQNWRPLEIVVLDAGSTDHSQDLYAASADRCRDAGIEFVFMPCAPAGVAVSRNLAATLATGDILFFLDNDATLDSPEAVARAAGFFIQDTRLAVLSCRINARDTAELDPACWVYRCSKVQWAGTPFDTFTFTGGGCALRRAPFRGAGGFWEALQYSREEEELAIALLDQGWRIRYTPEILVRHYPAQHQLRNLTKRRSVELKNGILIYWRRFPLPFAVLLIAARFTTMTLRALVTAEANPFSLCAALPAARKAWRDGHETRQPISIAGALLYLALNRKHRAESPVEPSLRIRLLDFPLDAVTEDEAVAHIQRAIASGTRLHVGVGNVDMIMKSRRDPTFKAIFDACGLVITDGVPLLWAAALLGTPLRGRVNGTDTVWRCAEISANTGRTIALVGSSHSVSLKAASLMSARYPGAQFCCIDTPFPLDRAASARIAEEIRAAGAALVLVALGAPKQERWVCDHLDATGACVGIGIGGALDLISGAKPRAPRWMQRNGLEWLHRIATDPRHVTKRYVLEDLPFLWHFFREWRRKNRTQPGKHA
ncbi:MAG: WecB/TagA/CpsF family glycosyltransferase [Candidatus Hydrogenedentes bacterium]|nr:WecB/TagA/CpsF family glycosyltransferase [Candidatus Hydrogenedentota bacterium]